MTQPIPTIDDVLTRTHLGGHFHQWGADGGVIRVTRAELLPALDAAYDPTTPDWPAMVEIGNDDNSWPLDGDDYFSGNDNA